MENMEKSGNLRVVRKKWEKRKSQGKCVLACDQLPRVLILTQNVQKRNYLLGEVVHHMMYKQFIPLEYIEEHSCHKNVMK